MGVLTDNDDMKRDGKTDQTAGKVKDFIGDVKDKADDLVDTVKRKVTEH